MTTMLRDRVTHDLKLGETEDSKTKVKYVHCTYEDGSMVYELNKETGPHPDTRISISMQDDIVWTSDKPFRIDLDRDKAANLFFRNKFPWNSVESVHDHKHRVHSGALDPSALPTVKLVTGGVRVKFTATQLVSPNGPTNDNVKKLDPHIIVEP